jgi:hypothetical protein
MRPTCAHAAINVIGLQVLNRFLVGAVIIMDHRRQTMGTITLVMLTLTFAPDASRTTGAHSNRFVILLIFSPSSIFFPTYPVECSHVVF